jgi:curved DNA-binding protein CbpA
MLTWYDVLGVSPGASPGQVRSAYQARARRLAPQMLAGAPTKVLKAADVAKAAVDEAWRVLGDPPPGTKVRRAATLSVQIWHPAAH